MEEPARDGGVVSAPANEARTENAPQEADASQGKAKKPLNRTYPVLNGFIMN